MKNFSKKLIASAIIVCSIVIMYAFKTGTGYNVGDTASDFKLKSTAGKMVSMADNKTAKGFIVIFTCNHCPFSVAYEQRIINLHKKYAAQGYPVIAINPNDKDIVPEDSYEEMQKRAKEKKYPFAYLYDETQAVAKMYGAARTPHVFVLQKEKSGLMVKYIGAIDNNADDASAATEHYVENAVNNLIAGVPVKQNFTKAIGCSIKWRKS